MGGLAVSNSLEKRKLLGSSREHCKKGRPRDWREAMPRDGTGKCKPGNRKKGGRSRGLFHMVTREVNSRK